jgi:hypothetical protein
MRGIGTLTAALGLAIGLIPNYAHAQTRRAPAGARAIPGVRQPRGAAPNQLFERLSKMPPAQRQKMLQNLPPERRQQLEDRLSKYNELSPSQKQQLADRYESFQKLPPERQEELRKMFRRFNSLPPERQGTLREEVQELYRMSESDRRSRMNSDEFRNKFNQQEQAVLRNFVDSLSRQE